MIGIVTDSTCDIPQHLVDQYGIIVVPLFILWGNETFLDRVEMSPKEFYDRLEIDPVRPTSSQASAEDFLNAIQTAVEQGADEVLIITISSAMSGTYFMAVKAAEQSNIPVTVIDSKGPTMTLGWQVLAAARARDEGANMPDIVKKVESVRDHMVQIVAMQTLEFLQTGGRIGDAVKWVGGLLKVKPVVSINHHTGRVQPVGLARSHQKAVEMLYRKFFDGFDGGKNLRIAVLHGGAEEEAQTLADRIREEFNPLELFVNMTGPVLGIHTGPGALALCGYSER